MNSSSQRDVTFGVLQGCMLCFKYFYVDAQFRKAVEITTIMYISYPNINQLHVN